MLSLLCSRQYCERQGKMKIKILNRLQRYVWWELFAASISAVAAITLFAFAVTALLFIRRYPVMGVQFFIGSALPLIFLVLPYTASLGVLVGSTLTFGQLANEREEIILQFNGIPLRVLLKPIVLLIFFSVAFELVATHIWQPQGFYAEDEQKFAVLRQSLKSLPSGANAFSFKTFILAYDNRIVEKRGKREEYWFTGLTLLFTKNERVTQMICAKKGKLKFSMARNKIFFDMEDCYTIFFNKPLEEMPQTIFEKRFSVSRKFINLRARPKMTKTGQGKAQFRLTPENPEVASKDMRLKTLPTPIFLRHLKKQKENTKNLEQQLASLSDQIWNAKKKLKKLTKSQAKNSRSHSIVIAENLDAEIEAVKQNIEHLKKELKDTSHSLKVQKSNLARNEAGFYRRIGMTFTPLSFILLGFPLGLLLKQGNKLVVFSLSLLIIGVAYYPVEQYFVRLVQLQKVIPYLVAIMPNLVVLFIVVVLSRFAFAK